MMRQQEPRPLSELLEYAPGPDWWVVLAAVGLVMHVAFAIAVGIFFRDRASVLVPSWLWVVATLVCGPLVGVACWLMHSSQSSGVVGPGEKPPS